MRPGYRNLAYWITCASTLAITACSIDVESERFTASQEGVRYALPIPLLEILPQPDGSITVDVKYIPDPNNEYVIRTSSIVSSYTLDVKTGENRLLESVTLDADSTGVPESLLKASGEVAKAKFEADKAAADKEAEKAQNAADKVAAAELQVKKAEAKLETLKKLQAQDESSVTPKEIVAAEVAMAEAKAELDAARSASDRLGLSSFDAPSAPESADFPTAWGPVYYRVVQDRDPQTRRIASVNLVAVRFNNGAGQSKFDTSSVAKPKRQVAVAKALELSVVGSDILFPNQNGRMQFQLAASAGVTDVGGRDKGTSLQKLVDEGQGVIVPVPVSITFRARIQTDNKIIFIDMPALDAGQYSLALALQQKRGGAYIVSSVGFTIGG